MSFVFQNGNVGNLEKRIEKLEEYHETPSPKNTKITNEESGYILTEIGLILKTE
ncbi:MAG: hypothetical protein ACRCX8_08580 [Sarcina sp.]